MLPANTPTTAKSLLRNQEQAADGIDLYVNADKTECFNQKGDNSDQNGGFLKLVDKFT